MAVGNVNASLPENPKGGDLPGQLPESGLTSNWVALCTAPETADNSGSSIVNPSLITRSDQNILDSWGFGMSLEVRLKYDDGVTSVTSPVIQVFGADVSSQAETISGEPNVRTKSAMNATVGTWQKLVDSNDDHELTLTVATSSDVTDGTYNYTKPVRVGKAGCRSFLVAVKTAFAATGTVDTSEIQVRLVSDVTPPPMEAVVTSSAIASVVPGTGATNLGKAEDAAHTTGDVGVMGLTVRRDTAAATATTDGDYQPPTTDASGRLWTHVGAIDAGTALIGKVGIDQTTPGTTNAVFVTNKTPYTAEVTVTVDNGNAYAANDIVGGIIEITTVNLSTGRRVKLKSIQVNDRSNEAADLHLLFFKSTPSGGTYADNGAPTWHADDSAKKVGQVQVLTADYLVDGGVASANIGCGDGIRMKPAATSLFLVITTQDAPTWATGDLSLVLEFEQE